MKKLPILMLLLTGALSFCAALSAGVTQEGAWNAVAGAGYRTSDGPLYALSSALTGTVSSTIDLTNYTGIFINVSSTPGGPGIAVQWNIDSTASPAMPWYTSEIVAVNGGRYLAKQGNQVRFKVIGTAGSYPTGASWNLGTTVTYIPLGSSDSSTWVTTTAEAVATSGNTDIDLTTVAGCSTCCLMVGLANMGTGGINFDIDTNTTSATLSGTFGAPLPAGGNAQLWGTPYTPGHFLHLRATGASATVWLHLEKMP